MCVACEICCIYEPPGLNMLNSNLSSTMFIMDYIREIPYISRSNGNK